MDPVFLQPLLLPAHRTVCKCSQCLEQNALGVEVSVTTARRHADRQIPGNLIHSGPSWSPPSPLSAGATGSSDPTHSTACPGPSNNAPIQTLCLLPNVLEQTRTQQLTNELCYLTSQAAVHRPRDLAFITPPDNRVDESTSTIPYLYARGFNPPPLSLIVGHDLNAKFLHFELQLRLLAEKVEDLDKGNGSKDTFQALRCRVMQSLALMHQWKQAIWTEQRKEHMGMLVRAPCIDIGRYVRLLNDNHRHPKELLPGFLLVLVLHFIYRLPQRPCTVVLAYMRTQLQTLRPYIGDVRYNYLLSQIPKTIQTVIAKFDLDPRLSRFVACPSCYALRSIPANEDFRGSEWKACGYQPTADSPACTTRLVRTQCVAGATVYRPIRYYSHQDVHDWIGRFLSRRDIEDFLDRQKLYYQICGYGSTTSEWFCTCCYLPKSQIENINKSTWPARNLQDHIFWANEWKNGSKSRQKEIFGAHGIRYTPFLELEYWDPISNSPVDTMHNLLLGLLQRHCRDIFGMNMASMDGDGSLKPTGKVHRIPPTTTMEGGRLALKMPGLEFLKECSVVVLWYLCFELDLWRGGYRRNLIQELAKWRTQNGVNNNNQTKASLIARASELPVNHLDIVPVNILVALCKSKGLIPRPKRGKVTVTKDDCIRLLKPAIQATNPPTKSTEKSNTHLKRSATVVLGKENMAEIIKDRERQILPPWVTAIPLRAGSKGHGKLSADQWCTLCTVHLPTTLIRLWGRYPSSSREYSMLKNYLDLVNAVDIANLFTTSPQHQKTYDALIMRYLNGIKELYKETTIVPNHHLALHVSDFQALWGPSPEIRGFGWERCNRDLQLMNINNKFGEIEETYTTSAARKANLTALISSSGTRESISDMCDAVDRIHREDAVGSRVHLPGVASFERNPFIPSKATKALSPELLELLCRFLNQENGKELYTPAAPVKKHMKQIFLHPRSVPCRSVNQGGVTYKPFTRSLGASNILLESAFIRQTEATSNLPYHPARLHSIFAHERLTSEGTMVKDVFCIVQLLQPISDAETQLDFFRQFGQVGGSLWSNRYDTRFCIIRPNNIVCHFGQTELRLRLDSGGPEKDYFHVQPLDRLRLHLEVRDITYIPKANDEDVGELSDDDEDLDFGDDYDERDMNTD
ncbi:hypothetical protein BKA70DRAFT_1223226 [Coprinopsis sp. MPI-PUGE-AT-0042]|nr:hypothetical protein BKA70DRAFT_1223226 [Coprinopsis sp. MPI-PUGE-AT-0042]